MIKVKVLDVLEKKKRSKYWLSKQMGVTSKNLNNFLNGKTTSVSFRYLEDICTFLECDFNDLFSLEEDKEKL